MFNVRLKNSIIIMMAALAITSFIVPKPVKAEGLTVGLSSWYCWWGSHPSGRAEYKPGLLYGPVLGFDFAEKWSVSTVLLTGNLKTEYSDPMYSNTTNYRRYDSDTVLSYNLTRWVKLFGGLKYIRYDSNDSGSKVRPFGSSDQTYRSVGPGFGAGLTFPVTDSLFLLTNFSVMYCYGKDNSADGGTKSRDRGFNTNVSMAYYIASVATTISGGVRYQYLNSANDGENSTTSFYGVTMMATHHVSFED